MEPKSIKIIKSDFGDDFAAVQCAPEVMVLFDEHSKVEVIERIQTGPVVNALIKSPIVPKLLKEDERMKDCNLFTESSSVIFKANEMSIHSARRSVEQYMENGFGPIRSKLSIIVPSNLVREMTLTIGECQTEYRFEGGEIFTVIDDAQTLLSRTSGSRILTSIRALRGDGALYRKVLEHGRVMYSEENRSNSTYHPMKRHEQSWVESLSTFVDKGLENAIVSINRMGLKTLYSCRDVSSFDGGSLPVPYVVILPKESNPKVFDALMEGLRRNDKAIFLPPEQSDFESGDKIVVHEAGETKGGLKPRVSIRLPEGTRGEEMHTELLELIQAGQA